MRNKDDTAPSLARDINGAFGDFGMLVAYVAGAITVGGLAAASVLAGFGLMLIASGLFYGIPMAVQPMKVVAAAVMTSGLSPADVAVTGVALGVMLLVLGLSGGISWMAKAVPQSVATGLQLGLGLTLCWLGVQMSWSTPWLGIGALAMFLGATRVRAVPLLPVVLAAGASAYLLRNTGALPSPALAVPFEVQSMAWSLDHLQSILAEAVLPQMAITLTNAVIVTAAVSRHLFPDRAARATARNLALTTGAGNLLLAPLGALPMCHGAGGVAAQARFGAATGRAPVILGSILLLLAFFFSDALVEMIAAVPSAIAGALLVVAGIELARSGHVRDARTRTLPTIAVTALLTLAYNPLAGLAGGLAIEAVGPVIRFLNSRFGARR